MKKYVIVALSLLLCVGVLVGCTPEVSRLDAMKSQVSYSQSGLVVGGNAEVRCEIATGSREISMISDGVASDLMEFCTLSITPIKYELYSKHFTFKLVGDKGEVSGECKKAIIGINQVADIMDVESLGTLTKLVVTYEEVVIELELTNAMEGMLTCDKVVESVYNSLTAEIEPMFDGNEFLGEVHAKITRDTGAEGVKYYWYVSITVSTDNNIYVLVDGATGAILAKKCDMNN